MKKKKRKVETTHAYPKKMHMKIGRQKPPSRTQKNAHGNWEAITTPMHLMTHKLKTRTWNLKGAEINIHPWHMLLLFTPHSLLFPALSLLSSYNTHHFVMSLVISKAPNGKN
jgi:hypothetical protein